MSERLETRRPQEASVDGSECKVDKEASQTATDRRVFLTRLAQGTVGTAVAACLPTAGYGQGQAPTPPRNVRIGISLGTKLATYEFLSPGWATFGLALPQGMATGAVQVGSLSTQTDVKTRWPDGSIRHAIVTANIRSGGSLPIAAGTNVGGSFTLRWPSASVTCTIGGVPYTASLPGSSALDQWLNGPLCQEARVVVKFPAPYDFLEAYFDIRSYNDGTHRVDVSVRNCLNVATARAVTYDVAVRVNGATVFSQAGLTHYFMQLWRRVFPVGLTEATWTPDVTPFYASNALPEFLSDMTTVKRTATFTPLNVSPMSPSWNGTGGRPDLYCYPAWTCEYLVHKTQTELAYMLNMASLSAGAWSLHIHETDGTVPNHTVKTAFKTVNVTGTNGSDGPANGNTGKHPDWWDEVGGAHSPSIGYVEYLITGDRFFLDTAKYRANRELNSRGAASNLADQQVRGVGWSMRNLAECAAIVPDADPEKSYFVGLVNTFQNNVDQYVETYWPLSSEPSGLCWSYTGGVITSWEVVYLHYGLWRARRLGFTTHGGHGETRTRDWLLKLVTSGTDLPWQVGCCFYRIRSRRKNGTKFATIAAFYNYNFVNNNGDDSPNPEYTNGNDAAGGYAVEFRSFLAIAAAQNRPGAAAALALVSAYHGYRNAYPLSALERARTSDWPAGHQFYFTVSSDSGPVDR